ncbi:hypothetical protein C8R44DRAFT_862351 [Mycena epipterygia]|nr:hypothetical protein C8R44DRAFT_862351 [Mycena epipterygia]
MSASSDSASAPANDEDEGRIHETKDSTMMKASTNGKKGAAGDESVAKTAAAAPGFFSWVLPAVRTRRTLKTWLRCVLALAGAMTLLVDNATLNSMGQAGFFAAIVAVLLPPSLALSVFVFASATLLIGMLLGWAWGAAIMAAAHAAQNKTWLAAREAAAEKLLVPGIDPALQLRILVFKGFFLSPRTSAVYGALFTLGTFVFGALRARAPKLQLLCLFGTIVLDVVATTGPLLPTPMYTLPELFLRPTAYYLAIAITSLVLVFPQSLNCVWLTTLDGGVFGPAKSILSLQATALDTRPSDREAWAGVGGEAASARAALGGGLAALSGHIALIDLEVSVGRLGPADLKRLAPEVRGLGLRVAGLMAFHTAVATGHLDDAVADALSGDKNQDGNNENGKNKPSHESRFARRRRLIREREAQHGHDLDTLVPILASASAPLRAASEDAAATLRAWFVDCNQRRWTGLLWRVTGKQGDKAEVERVEGRQRGLVEARDKLEGALKAFREGERARLIRPYERFFDKETGRLVEGGKVFALRSLFMCFVFCDTLDVFAARLHRVLTLVTELDKKRPGVRVWMPSGFGKIGRKVFSRGEEGAVEAQPLAMGTESDPTQFGAPESSDGDAEEDAEEGEALPAPRNPDARAPTSALGRFFVAVGASLRFFKTPEGIFALRHAAVSLALWVPSVVPHTANFYYENKGLWALIMAQSGLAPFAGDQLAGLAARLLGTIAGLLNGMVVWYIAAPGKRDGNPYAVVVVTAVFTAPFLLARLAAPPAQMMVWTMVGVTTVFVVGYSWLDTHFAVLSNPGVGISVGWKRALLVIIGFTAGAIVMMFPRPTSARTLVRRTLAATMRELGAIFGQEVEAFLAEEARARGGHYEQQTIDFLDEAAEDAPVSPKERRVRKVARRVLVVFERLQGLAPSLKTGQWEPQVQGSWPHEQYELLHSKETKMVTSLSLLAGAFSKLNTKWCSILVHRTPFLNPNLLSDIFSKIEILSHALEAGHPVPASLPCLRDRLIYHEALVRAVDRDATAQRAAREIPLDPEDEETAASDSGTAEIAPGKVDGASIGFEELSLDVLMLIDEMGTIVRELCGETTFRGFEALHHEFQEREEAAMGTFAIEQQKRQ